jgi:MSHA biogenesis protein MshE
MGARMPGEIQLKAASGCHRCNNTGYLGRIGVFELLVLNDDMADALRRSSTADFVKAARQSRGYRPLVISALEEAFKGVTTLDEVYRVAEQIDESGEFSLREDDLEIVADHDDIKLIPRKDAESSEQDIG